MGPSDPVNASEISSHRRVLIAAVSAKLPNNLKQRLKKHISINSKCFWSNPQGLCELQPESRSWVKIDWVICMYATGYAALHDQLKPLLFLADYS